MIPIQSEPEAAGCGHCDASVSLPACLGSQPAFAEAPPEWRGPAEPLQALVAALEADWSAMAGRPLRAAGIVRSFHLQAGEAELVLSIAGHCGGQLLADCAFHTLRRLLPDTDIYVRSAPGA